MAASLVLLGLALPARDVLARSQQGRIAATQRRAIGDGVPLDASDPSVHALVDAYGACLAIAGSTGDERGREAADAAHLAMVEVASLLAGQRPVAAAEIDYVNNRTRAIERLTTSLRGVEHGRADSRVARLPDRTTSEQEWATAVTRAREELESDTGLGSLDRLAVLTNATEVKADDAAR